MKDAQDEG